MTSQNDGPTSRRGTRQARRRHAGQVLPRLRFRDRMAGFDRRLRAMEGRWLSLVEPVAGPVRRLLACVSPLGWLVAAGSVLSWVLAVTLGWQEFRYAAAALAVLFLLACLLTLGRTSLEVDLRVEPQRVIAGDGAALQVRVTNVGKAPMMPVPLDVPAVGETVRFGLPGMAPGSTFEDVVVLPSQRRGVYPIGPATTLRGDPFGLVRRELTWTEPVEFFVHPRSIYIDSLGSGMLKDLEGQSTNQMSMSDLAFHTLREYAPGDDRRHIHWLSTAKRSGASGGDEFMVRQFLDTRRSHIGVVLDCLESSYLTDEEFETAVSVGSSVAMRALRDGMDLSEITGPFFLTRPRRHTALDLFSRARLGAERIDVAAATLAHQVPNISAVLFVTGALGAYELLRRAKHSFGPDVNVVAIRVELGASMGLQKSGGMPVITIGHLKDLPMAIQGRVSG